MNENSSSQNQPSVPSDILFRRRVSMTVVGVLICGLSVGMFQYSRMGMDPFQTFSHGIATLFPSVPFGTVYMIICAILLVFDFFTDRHRIGIATFINLFLLGYVVDWTNNALTAWIASPSLALRIVFLAAGLVLLCFSSALYFTGDLGVSAYDAIALTWSEKRHRQFRWIRIFTDVVCTVIGALLGIMPGVGTILTAFCMGPLIDWFNVHAARPFLYRKAR